MTNRPVIKGEVVARAVRGQTSRDGRSVKVPTAALAPRKGLPDVGDMIEIERTLFRVVAIHGDVVQVVLQRL